ncbi:LysR family transcriptional regulator [Rhodovulum sp. YNF3179]|uniref:LysR family transcriptional regulator n=1 Tax=Rhodovulum sp. YNF3179 TaxID=3425127 RepID=UPI003D349AB0
MRWDDIKIFLAVAEAGSTLRAAKRLGVNQTTVSRRLDALEAQTGLVLFQREMSGYRLTRTGEAFLEACKPARAVFENVEARARRLADASAENIRVTGPAEAIHHWVAPILERFRASHPDVVMELDTSETQLDLNAGDADIALRMTDEIDDESLIARRVATVPWGLYCSRAYEQAKGAPRDLRDLPDHRVIHYSARMSRTIAPIRRLSDALDPAQVVLRVSSVPGMVASLKGGQAVGLLPCSVGDATPDLVPCFRHPEFGHNCWLVASREAYARQLVRACMKQIADEFPRKDL